jgi:uncharacterized protein YdeI (YjbR/CyaY-like superfamily)
MPADIAVLLEERNLMTDYLGRPPYQQNDYLGWISRAKLEITRSKRINQMLCELADGQSYMNMPYKPRI